ncbi:hypothetical protein [Xanthomarina sp. F2636L]|uniref:hypothetical protein n=1 Tax=Xanthomarina sp. F2636L TaxID=2996018 RepID=UPI00225E06E6|nr:hypothetical protein [Xanthomarina sp. F2636L]MCX7552126.1 hypothetical protein [Xanthomarina sp. F2636L]
MNKLIFGLLTLILVTSCSDDTLTNEIASKIISEKYPTFCSQGYILKDVTFYAVRNTQDMIETRNKSLSALRYLENQGLINVKEKRTGIMSNPDIKYYLELTDKAIEL